MRDPSTAFFLRAGTDAGTSGRERTRDGRRGGGEGVTRIYKYDVVVVVVITGRRS